MCQGLSRDERVRNDLSRTKQRRSHVGRCRCSDSAPQRPADQRRAVSPPAALPRSLADAIQPVAHETRDRIITGLLTVIPFLMLGFVVWQLAGSWLHWSDLVVFAMVYIPCGLGITVGFHRLFTHRSFKTGPAVRAVIGALGSAAIEGPMISWVADHRKHHAFSDQEGDPHSPHVGHGEGVWAQFKGFFHAHLGWLFIHTQRGSKTRFAPDLLKDPVARFIDRTFVLWALVGLRSRSGWASPSAAP